MSKSAERGGLHKHRRLGSGAPERKGPVSPVNGHRQRGAAHQISAESDIQDIVLDHSLIRRCGLIPTPRLKKCLIVNFRTDRRIPCHSDRLPVQRSGSIGS